MTVYYAVKVGRIPGIYTSWTDAAMNVNGFSGAIYKKFGNLTAAQEFMGIASAPADAPASESMKSPKLGNIIKPVVRIRKKVDDMNDIVETALEREYYSHHDYKATDVLHVYTDGSAYNNGRKNAYGGYGVFFASREIPNISKRITSGKITNNVGELRAIIDAMKVLQRHASGRKCIIHYDSEYAEGVTTGKKRAHTNLELVQESKLLYREMRDRITFEHIMAHTGGKDLHSIGNEIADALAKGLKNF